MSLTRYLPTPSDRMGVLWSLLEIEGSVVLEYGPAGTTHFSMSLLGELGIEQQNRLYTTHMSEADVVLGDVQRLEEAIIEIEESCNPKVIFILASSVAAVVGVDIRGICTYMQERVKAKLIPFEQGGFRGDYYYGIEAVWSTIEKEIVKKKEKREGTYTIIGASAWSYRMQSDIKEIERLLWEAFGMKMNGCHCFKTSIEELENSGDSSLNIVISSNGISVAERLKEKFDIEYVVGKPYGYKGTLQWLEEIGQKIGKEIQESVRREIEERIDKTRMYTMYARMLRRDKMRATFVGEYDTIIGLSSYLQTLGIEVNETICTHSIKAIEHCRENVVYYTKEKEKIESVKAITKQILFADDTFLELAPSSNLKVRISNPVLYGMDFAKHMPLVGIYGADYLLEFVQQYVQTLK